VLLTVLGTCISGIKASSSNETATNMDHFMQYTNGSSPSNKTTAENMEKPRERKENTVAPLLASKLTFHTLVALNIVTAIYI
jgi:hypothetical protein